MDLEVVLCGSMILRLERETTQQKANTGVLYEVTGQGYWIEIENRMPKSGMS